MQSSEIFDTERITAVCENSGERIDALLTHIVPELSRSAAQRLTQEGSVLVNGRAVKKNHVCREGDSVEVFLPPAVPTEIVAQDIPLDVVYEDADVIAVNKPRGMVVHPAPGHPDGTLVNALLWHCGASLSGIGGEIRPG
ncbi:MAG: MoaD/ThiS family protein, partial [Oscillospiraceae bacterium]|nr:MoaD/ThiS family protein [Oscillospiraceae bacterium]